MNSLVSRLLNKLDHLHLIFMMICLLLILSGCKVEVYSDLTERQANKMLSVLIKSGVRTTKKSLGKGKYHIRVDSKELARAVEILDTAGLPGDDFVSMAELYKKEGMISSPMEERIRYMYALSQSIAETLTNIDGVLVARVHVALPESDKYSGDARPTSASIFIKHLEGFSHSTAIPEMKRIVENSIEGLSYERIAIFMSAAEPALSSSTSGTSTPLTVYERGRGNRYSIYITYATILVTVSLIVAFAVMFSGYKKSKVKEDDDNTSISVLRNIFIGYTNKIRQYALPQLIRRKRSSDSK